MAKKIKKSSNKTWFYRVRGSYLPKNSIGWLLYIPFIIYLAFSFVVAIKDIASIWVVLLFIVANWLTAGFIMTAIAKSKS
jgi:hypothetical protein